MSIRWVQTKIKRYIEMGIAGLVHGNRGKPSPHKISDDQKAKIVELMKGPFYGFGPTFAAEKLKELYGIDISKESLRNIIIKAGVWENKPLKIKHRQRRERKPCRGIMIQLDGSPHDWFEGRGPKCTLLVFIDDATSEILWLEFAPSESAYAVMQATKNYLESCGRPCSFYTDYGSVFRVNTNNPEHDKITQYERALHELAIEIIHARSPQAKGRVERANKTLQDRLVKEMRLAGICSIEQANAFIVSSGYLSKHNAQFAVEATNSQDAHRPLDGYNLDTILCIKENRVLTNDFTISYNKRIFQLSKHQRAVLKPKDSITVREQLDGRITLAIRATALNFKELSCRPVKPQKTLTVSQFVHHKPAADHPWRRFDYTSKSQVGRVG